MKKLVVAALLASAISVPASAAELVANGGFEDPLGLDKGWSHSVTNNLAIILAPGQAHGGDEFLRFSGHNSGETAFVSESLDTVVGATYTWSYWISAETSNGDALSAFEASIGDLSLGQFQYTGTFGWTQFTGSYVATSAKTLLSFSGFNTAGAYYLDDVSVMGPTVEIDVPVGGAVPEPATWAMMLLGFFAIGATLRGRKAGALAVAA